VLHGFGGLTSRTRTGRDVEEAAIIAMGPAAGLALGLLVFAGWQLALVLGVATPTTASVVYAMLYPCIVWNLLNLMPLWPLDGGQLLRLGLLRWLSPRRASRVTHGLALTIIALLAAYILISSRSVYTLLLLGLLAMQNVRAFGGNTGDESAPTPSTVAAELVENARLALREERFKEAARLAQQARAQSGVSPSLLDQIWEVLGLATTELGEYEEALSYLSRAKPNERVRQATTRCLTALGREEELQDVDDVIHVRSVASTRGRHMDRWLWGALGFIALAICMVFGTSMKQFFF
jgi:tetratricopeptide (TPR) repeat protein